MTTNTNNNLMINNSFMNSSMDIHNDSHHVTQADVSTAFANVSDRLDEGKFDPETLHLVGKLKSALMASAGNVTPTTLTPILPGVPTPTKLIPGVATPTTFIQSVPLISNTEVADKLFSWVKVYTLNALYSMPGSMMANSEAIQTYMSDGLNKLSESVMNQSQAWSTYNQAMMTQIEGVLKGHSQQDPTKDPATANECEADTTAFNMQNTFYQKMTEMYGSQIDGITQTSSSTTQTQTLNNQNIVQGPLAMIQMLTQCWSVIV